MILKHKILKTAVLHFFTKLDLAASKDNTKELGSFVIPATSGSLKVVKELTASLKGSQD